MGFAAPFGLAALLALLLPLAIHLRRRRSSRTVRVGSVRHLAGASPPPRAGLRVTEPRLLAVRLLVMGLLALMLAKPFVPAMSGPARPRSVALVSRQLSEPESPPAAAILLDSLRAAGAEIRVIEPETDVWNALRSVDADLPGNSRIALVTTERARVSGARPRIRAAVSVHVVPHPADSQSHKRRQEPTRRRVTIAAKPERVHAARYLSAAFRSVAEAHGDTLELRRQGPADPAAPSAAGDWIVWLGDAPDDTALALARRGFNVLTDGGASGNEAEARSDIRGAPLDVRRAGDGLIFTLGGRFDTSSGDLVLSGALPELLATIWPEPDLQDHAALAWVSAPQLRPAPAPPRSDRQRTAPAVPLLVLATLFFLLERWLAHRPAPIRAA